MRQEKKSLSTYSTSCSDEQRNPATEYATLKKKPDGTLPTYDEIKAVYDKYYANEKFVRVLKKGVCPETKWVEGSNYVDVNL